MKKWCLLFIFGLCFFGAFSQIFSGKVIDIQDQKPVPYANIGIIGKDRGTVSDMNGEFKLELDSNYDKDTIRISCIGFEHKKYLVLDIKRADFIKIELSPKAYRLSEVIIHPTNTKTYALGNFCDSSSCYGNSFRSGKLGTEIGIMMELPRKTEKAFLKSFRFYVGEFTFDKFPVRINIYSGKNGQPYQNILKAPIFVDIISAGEYIVDLVNYNIITTGDFFISLEYYRIHGQDDGKLTFCAVHNRKMFKGNGFYRLTSQGNWLPEPGDNLGFSVLVECD